ncbi:Outer membrane receptor proteins, mostly Fe transport [Pedobacter terrae]|uniref:Outer membrane receptor proteins, mostly Fe transport n=1 Tax=Pedobacter terrae TaxID=405671 RepID=A0A1G8EF15_9SPHI|nr:TonB-dependent receptor [Pedobacter terrae]SDH68390.1 Outer membrane receptor proteins, mostly Fe transport [Pedobacter terrae]
MKTFFLIYFVFLVAGNAFSQSIDGQISGRVIDKNKLPLPGATVELSGAKDTLYKKASDQNGFFIFTGLSTGIYSVKASLMSYKTAYSDTIRIDSAIQKIELKELILMGDEISLAQVNIRGKKPLIETKIDRVVMNIENSILAAGNSALDILQRAPGVSVENGGNISLVGKQNVIVMINDKPTYLSQSQLAALLRSTEGSTIKEIEIISNPSAKYDAAGTGGIINIKLKKNSDSGLNGSLTGGFGYGGYYKTNGGTVLNYKRNKINVFGNYFYNNNKRFQDYFIDRVNESSLQRLFFSESSRAIAKNISNNYRAGIDYSISDNHLVGATYSGYTFNQNEAVLTNTQISNSSGLVDSSVVSANNSKNFLSNNSVNLNYTGSLDTLGQKINVDLDYSRFTGDQFTAYQNSFYQGNSGSLKYQQFSRNFSPYSIDIKSAKADFAKPFSKNSKLDLGAKLSSVRTENDLTFERLENEIWNKDFRLSNKFIYTEKILAAYINYNLKLGRTSLQAGLRTEDTRTNANSVSQGLITNKHYFNFFPSIFINHELSKLYQLNISYSRRIERPNYQDLNPFVYYLDQYTYGKGNPNLNPQYTDAFELSFLSKAKVGLSAKIGYSDTRDAITEVILADTAQKSLYQMYENLARNKNYYLNINISTEVGNFWTSNNSIGIFKSSFSAPNIMDESFNSSNTAFNLKSINNFTITKTTSAELYGNYQTSTIYGIVKIAPRYTIDIGLKQSFGKEGQADLKLSISDVFNTYTRKISSILMTNPYFVEYKNETQIARLTFSYRFGNKNNKNRSDRNGGADTEKGRAGNSKN